MKPQVSGSAEGKDFALDLPRYDSWFTLSRLVALVLEGRVEALQPGKRNKRYRLVGRQ